MVFIQPETLAGALLAELIRERRDYSKDIFVCELLQAIERTTGVIFRPPARDRIFNELVRLFEEKRKNPQVVITPQEIVELLWKIENFFREEK